MARTRRIEDVIANSSSPTVWLNAAYTDVKKAEAQKGDKKGMAWQVNVVGTRNVALAAKKHNKFLICTGTGFIYPGEEDNKGPYEADASPAVSADEISWYGWTKLQGEHVIDQINPRYAIVRIDYPFGNLNAEKDYLRKIGWMLEQGYPLFEDQIVTPTFIPDVAMVLQKISSEELEGVFHVACEPVTPYSLALMIKDQVGDSLEVKNGSMKQYVETNGRQLWPLYGGLATKKTQQKLGVEFHSTEKALEKLFK